MTNLAISTRLLLALIAAAGLGGCAVYPAAGYGPYENYGSYGQPYGIGISPALISGSVTYERSFGGGGYYGNGYGPGYAPNYAPGYGPRFAPNYAPGYAPGYGPNYVPGHGRHHGRGRGDRDGDRIPNRFDRDRNGDGVPNRQDARPNNRRSH